MYIKAPKRMGDSHVAAVVETDDKTKCFFPETVVCDVDDIFVRFVVTDAPGDSVRDMDRVVEECLSQAAAWSYEHGLQPPAHVSSPFSVVRDGLAFLKVRVPRDGHTFAAGDKCKIAVSVRDVKLSAKRLTVNWRIEEYVTVTDAPQEAAGTVAGEAPDQEAPDQEDRAPVVSEAGEDVSGVAEAADDEPRDEAQDLVESGIKTVRETLALLQLQMDEFQLKMGESLVASQKTRRRSASRCEAPPG